MRSHRSRKKLFGVPPTSIMSPHLEDDIALHVDYILKNLTLVSVVDRTSGNAKPLQQLRQFLVRRAKYHLAGSLLAFFPLKRRDPQCILWKRFKCAVISTCPSLARAENLLSSYEVNSIKARYQDPTPADTQFPATWSNLHLAAASRNSAWLRYMVAALVSVRSSASSSSPLDKTSGVKASDVSEEDLHSLSKFRESLCSLFLCCCYYNDRAGITSILEFVALDVQASAVERNESVSDDELSRIHLAAVSANEILRTLFSEPVDGNSRSQILNSFHAASSPRSPQGNISNFRFRTANSEYWGDLKDWPFEMKSLVLDSDTFEPLGRQFTPLDLCLHQRSEDALTLLLQLGTPIAWDSAVRSVCSGKFKESTCVTLMDAVATSDGIAEKLNSRPAFVNASRNELLLHFACRRGLSDLCRKLLQLGADTCAPDSDGLTAVHYSVYAGHANITRLLVSHHRHVSEFQQNGPDAGKDKGLISRSRDDFVGKMLSAVKILEFYIRQFLLSRYRRRVQLAKWKVLYRQRRRQHYFAEATGVNVADAAGQLDESPTEYGYDNDNVVDLEDY
jgi:hypothetical protein